jgi:hypothetical protein
MCIGMLLPVYTFLWIKNVSSDITISVKTSAILDLNSNALSVLSHVLKWI